MDAVTLGGNKVFLQSQLCAITGQPMSAGWYFDGTYIKDEDDALAYVIDKGFTSLEDAYGDGDENCFGYWSEWYLEDDGYTDMEEAYDEDGKIWSYDEQTDKWFNEEEIDTIVASVNYAMVNYLEKVFEVVGLDMPEVLEGEEFEEKCELARWLYSLSLHQAFNGLKS